MGSKVWVKNCSNLCGVARRVEKDVAFVFAKPCARQSVGGSSCLSAFFARQAAGRLLESGFEAFESSGSQILGWRRDAISNITQQAIHMAGK